MASDRASIAGSWWPFTREDQPTDRVRRPAAIVHQVGPRLVARDEHVLAERAQQILEQVQLEPEPPDRVGQRREDRRGVTGLVGDATGGGLLQPPLPCLETRQTLGRGRLALVGEVVRHARERVDRGDVRSRGLRHQPRGDRKILVVARAPAAGTRDRRRRLPLDFGRARAGVGGAGHHEEQIGEAVEVDAARARSPLPRSTTRRSARRQTARATCSSAPASHPPGRMKRRSGGSGGLEQIDAGLERANARPRRTGSSRRAPQSGARDRRAGRRRRTDRAGGSRSAARGRTTPAGRAPARATPTVRRRRRTRPRAGRPSTPACRRTDRSRPASPVRV